MEKWIRTVVRTEKDGMDCLKTCFHVLNDVDVMAGTNDGDGDRKRTYIKLSVPEYSLINFKTNESNGRKELEIHVGGMCEHDEIMPALQFALDAIESITDNEVIEPEI